MKKLLLFLTVNIIAINFAFSQGAAINSSGTEADPSAMLDVNANNKGVLIPRVALTGTDDVTTIPNPATSLLVYNTTAAGFAPHRVLPGYYYWKGSTWQPIEPTADNIGDMQYWNGTTWVMVAVGQPGQFLQLAASNIPSWSGNAYPTLITSAASSITGNDATSGGEVTSDGGAEIEERGICWSTSPNPTTTDNIMTDCWWCGTGGFTSYITGLTPATTYYIRAYAINSIGTGYGNQESFTTAPAQLPELTTTALSSIGGTYATSGGDVTSDGGATVTTRGVCWSTSTNPTIANSTTTSGSGTGTFTSSMTGLTPLVTYYVRAYATNSTGTAYGNEESFTTPPIVLPGVTTAATSSIGLNHAISGGNVTSDGGTTVTRGVCWSTSANPTIANSITTNGSGTGTFTSSMTGLTSVTTYYVRAYATNSAGTAYGNEVTFTTSAVLSIGDSHQGGVVGYILQSGDPGYISGQTHGLIAGTPGDQAYEGWRIIYTTTGATGTALGTGNANTNAIVSSQGAGTYAAKTCYDLVLNTYSDWYLPSKDELNKLYINRVAIGGFTTNWYWSSTESSFTHAWGQDFSNGFAGPDNKNRAGGVRAVRSF